VRIFGLFGKATKANPDHEYPFGYTARKMEGFDRKRNGRTKSNDSRQFKNLLNQFKIKQNASMDIPLRRFVY
jgi:hypothetical protein